jgi:hypothetical protein
MLAAALLYALPQLHAVVQLSGTLLQWPVLVSRCGCV